VEAAAQPTLEPWVRCLRAHQAPEGGDGRSRNTWPDESFRRPLRGLMVTQRRDPRFRHRLRRRLHRGLDSVAPTALHSQTYWTHLRNGTLAEPKRWALPRDSRKERTRSDP